MSLDKLAVELEETARQTAEMIDKIKVEEAGLQNIKESLSRHLPVPHMPFMKIILFPSSMALRVSSTMSS